MIFLSQTENNDVPQSLKEALSNELLLSILSVHPSSLSTGAAYSAADSFSIRPVSVHDAHYLSIIRRKSCATYVDELSPSIAQEFMANFEVAPPFMCSLVLIKQSAEQSLRSFPPKICDFVLPLRVVATLTRCAQN